MGFGFIWDIIHFWPFEPGLLLFSDKNLTEILSLCFHREREIISKMPSSAKAGSKIRF